MNPINAIPEELTDQELSIQLLNFFTEYFVTTINSTCNVELSGYSIKKVAEIENYTSYIRRFRVKCIHVVHCHAKNYIDFDLGIDRIGNFWMVYNKKGDIVGKRVQSLEDIIVIRSNS